MIKISNVSKQYKLGQNTIKAVDAVSLEIEAKSFVAITGPSGSGKSSLLHLIGGLDHPDSGDIIVNNTNITKLKDNQLAEYRNKHLGFVFQSFNLQPILTAAENASLPLVFANVPNKQRQKKAIEALQKVGLAERVNHKPSELSGGELQRVAIARALINDPEILIADEPTGNLDSKTGKKIMELFTKLNKEHGLTIIIVTHNAEDARYAAKEIKMRDGKIVN